MIVGWASASFCLFWLVFGLYKVQLSPIVAATYSSLSHTAWALALAWIVVACSSGNGGYVNNILAAPVIYPFSRVTYCAYLVHPVAIRFVSLSSDATLHLGSDSMVSFDNSQCICGFFSPALVELRKDFMKSNLFSLFPDGSFLRPCCIVIYIGIHNIRSVWSACCYNAQNPHTKSKENFSWKPRVIAIFFSKERYIYLIVHIRFFYTLFNFSIEEKCHLNYLIFFKAPFTLSEIGTGI